MFYPAKAKGILYASGYWKDSGITHREDQEESGDFEMYIEADIYLDMNEKSVYTLLLSELSYDENEFKLCSMTYKVPQADYKEYFMSEPQLSFYFSHTYIDGMFISCEHINKELFVEYLQS